MRPGKLIGRSVAGNGAIERPSVARRHRAAALCGLRPAVARAGLPTRAITIQANSSSVVDWWAEAKAMGTITVTMRIKADQAADAVLLTLPMVPLAVPEVHALIGDLTSSVEHTITWPQGFIAEASTLQIDPSPSIAASVLDGVSHERRTTRRHESNRV